MSKANAKHTFILSKGLDPYSEGAKVIKELGNLCIPTRKTVSTPMQHFERLQDINTRHWLTDKQEHHTHFCKLCNNFTFSLLRKPKQSRKLVCYQVP
eukprot:1883730-Ditylum_brightwellii.AAC.1